MAKKLCKHYLDALNESSLEQVLALFTDDAVVHSPLYGEMSADAFYRDLFSDTQQSDTRLLNVFNATDDGKVLALHFHYRWTLHNGETVSFEVVDVFELSDTCERFTKLTIIYDTWRIRQPHADSQRGEKPA
ncbi:MAG: nuclear transport factor 2 family protein [Marinobacterium sp.]|nr:nuclear transport factor 2 family protein [Marinobacterium sp.]